MSDDKRDEGPDQEIDKDKSLRIGSMHGDATGATERTGYGRHITQDGKAPESGREARTKGAGLTAYAGNHPSRNLSARTKGFGIGGGYERPYRKERPKAADSDAGLYGPLPHSGYYGSGLAAHPFKVGEASFSEELSWYRSQYGEKTTMYEKKK